MKQTIHQPTNFIKVLSTEQAMGSYALQRKIEEQFKNDKTLKIRFYALGRGSDIWVSGLTLLQYDFDMMDFLTIGCEIEEHEAEIIAQSWDVIAADGYAEEKGFESETTFNWKRYHEFVEALDKHSEDKIEAALVLGIGLDDIEKLHRGEYKSFKDFATEQFNELSLYLIPEEFHKFIDYDAVAEDYDESYYFENGHVFDAVG